MDTVTVEYEEGENLDCIPLDDLEALRDAIKAGAAQEAYRLFPSRPRGAMRAARLYGQYATLAAEAHHCRLAGKIQLALDYEAKCEVIYGQLPGFAKW